MLELYIAEHRRYPEGFPYRFVESAVSVREVRSFRITAVAKADLPLVTIEVLLKAWLADRAVRIRGG